MKRFRFVEAPERHEPSMMESLAGQVPELILSVRDRRSCVNVIRAFACVQAIPAMAAAQSQCVNREKNRSGAN